MAPKRRSPHRPSRTDGRDVGIHNRSRGPHHHAADAWPPDPRAPGRHLVVEGPDGAEPDPGGPGRGRAPRR